MEEKYQEPQLRLSLVVLLSFLVVLLGLKVLGA